MGKEIDRDNLVHAFFRGHPLSGKVYEGVKKYIIALEKDNRKWRERNCKIRK